MIDNQLFTLSIDESFSDRESIYTWVAEKNANDNLKPLEIKKALLNRELQGDIQISRGIVLPHFESCLLKRSNISLIHPKNPIHKWDGIEGEINFIIALSLKPNESEEREKLIIKFIRSLVEEDFIKELKEAKSKERIHFLLSEKSE